MAGTDAPCITPVDSGRLIDSAAMSRDEVLPAIDVYELRTPCPDGRTRSEYYVVDGHHRVAVARRFGQEFLDAHVVLYRVSLALGD